MYIVELFTRQGRVSERYETYVEARRRVELYPTEALLSLPLIFQELADGSERLVREDGKPLQFHRRLEEQERGAADALLPLADDSSSLLDSDGKLRLVDPAASDDGWHDLPLA
jgi:hypothetical protein